MTPAEGLAYVALALCGATILMALVRFVRGPSLADRVVAIDKLSAVAVGAMAALGGGVERPGLPRRRVQSLLAGGDPMDRDRGHRAPRRGGGRDLRDDEPAAPRAGSSDVRA